MSDSILRNGLRAIVNTMHLCLEAYLLVNGWPKLALADLILTFLVNVAAQYKEQRESKP